MATKTKNTETAADDKRRAELARLEAEQRADDRRDFVTARPESEPDRTRQTEATPRRRDHRYVPAGYVDIGTGTLAMLPDPEDAPAPMAEDDIHVAMTVIANVLGPLIANYGDPTADAAFDQTVDELCLRAFRARPLASSSPNWRRKVRAMFEVLRGHPPGEGWRAVVASALHQDVYWRENRRRNPRRAEPPGTAAGKALLALWDAGDRFGMLPRHRDVTDRELLEWIAAQTDVPADLTVKVLRAMRQSASLGGGGGRGSCVKKSPRRIVDDFAQALNDPAGLAARVDRKKRRPTVRKRRRRR